MAKRTVKKRAGSHRPAGRKKGLSGAQLLKRGKTRLHELKDIPGLGDDVVYVKLTARDLLAFTELEREETVDEETGEVVKLSTTEQANRQNDLLAKCLVNEGGETILTADQAQDLSEMDWELYMGVVRGVMDVIGRKQDDAVGKDVTPLAAGENLPTS